MSYARMNSADLLPICQGTREAIAQSEKKHSDEALEELRSWKNFCRWIFSLGFLEPLTLDEVRESVEKNGDGMDHFKYLPSTTSHEDYKLAKRLEGACQWAGQVCVSAEDLARLEAWNND